MHHDTLIIGSGLSGLACAQHLRAHGVTALVLDKGRGVGGRMATRRIGEPPLSFDTGAQFFTARSDAFQSEVARWISAGVCAPWTTALLDGDGVVRDDGVQRYRGCGGMTAIAKHLAQGLTCETQVEITRLEVQDSVVTAIATDSRQWQARRVVLTQPVPQQLALLDRSNLSESMATGVVARLRAVRYHACLCFLLDYRDGTAALPSPGALRCNDEREAVQWLLSHRSVGMRTRGEGLTVHLRGAWSDAHYTLDDAAIIAAARPLIDAALQRWCGAAWRMPEQAMLKKWRYSHALHTISEACWRLDMGVPLVLAGDAFGDAPRVEGAWTSGIAAARALLSES